METTSSGRTELCWLAKLIHTRRKQKRNLIIIVHAQGETGVGKSYLCMRLAEKWDKTFVASRIVFDAEDFINLCQTLPPESIVIYDDAAATVDRSKWHDAVNLAIKYTLQTFRKKRITVMFNCPHPKNLDNNVFIQSGAIIRVYQPGLAKCYSYTKNWIDGAEYTTFHDWLGNPDNMADRVKPPSPKLVEEYEKRKDDFIAATLLKGRTEIRTAKAKLIKKPSADEIYGDIINRNTIEKYKTSRGRARWNTALIGADYSISSTKAYQVTAKLEDAHHYERSDEEENLSDASEG